MAKAQLLSGLIDPVGKFLDKQNEICLDKIDTLSQSEQACEIVKSHLWNAPHFFIEVAAVVVYVVKAVIEALEKLFINLARILFTLPVGCIFKRVKIWDAKLKEVDANCEPHQTAFKAGKLLLGSVFALLGGIFSPRLNYLAQKKIGLAKLSETAELERKVRGDAKSVKEQVDATIAALRKADQEKIEQQKAELAKAYEQLKLQEANAARGVSPEVASLKDTLATATHKAQAAEERFKDLERQLFQKNMELDSIRSAGASTKTDQAETISNLTIQITQLSKSLEESRATLKKTESELATAKSEAAKQIEALKTTLSTITQEIEVLTKTVSDQKAALEADDKTKSLSQTNAALTKQLAEKTLELTNALAELSTTKTNLEALTQQKVVADAERAKLQIALNEANTAKDAAEQTKFEAVTELEEQIAALKAGKTATTEPATETAAPDVEISAPVVTIVAVADAPAPAATPVATDDATPPASALVAVEDATPPAATPSVDVNAPAATPAVAIDLTSPVAVVDNSKPAAAPTTPGAVPLPVLPEVVVATLAEPAIVNVVVAEATAAPTGAPVVVDLAALSKPEESSTVHPKRAEAIAKREEANVKTAEATAKKAEAAQLKQAATDARALATNAKKNTPNKKDLNKAADAAESKATQAEKAAKDADKAAKAAESAAKAAEVVAENAEKDAKKQADKAAKKAAAAAAAKKDGAKSPAPKQ